MFPRWMSKVFYFIFLFAVASGLVWAFQMIFTTR